MRKPSATDLELIAHVAARGYDVTPRQLERWRQAGALDTPRRIGLGRGRGTTTQVTGLMRRQVVRIAKGLESGKTLSEIR
jgi:hypothetical protein